MGWIKTEIEKQLADLGNDHTVCGVVDRDGEVFPLGADTKVLSTVFELISRPLIYQAAAKHGYKVVEASVQNHYPDFTIQKRDDDTQRIAVDVKTTWRKSDTSKFSFTLGSYTSFIHPEKNTKNIVYPFDTYAEHWVLGFVYERAIGKKSSPTGRYTTKDLEAVPVPFKNVECFIQEKWRISSGQAGSGNTANIGSIRGTLDEFRNGAGEFHSEEEFLDYWRGYQRTKKEREEAYATIAEYRALKA